MQDSLAIMPILASETLLRENKNSSNKMLPLMSIEPEPVINFWFQDKNSPFWTNLAGTTWEILTSLHAPLDFWT